MAPKTWLITGCSSGFGAEFVQQLTALGDNVIACGRNADTKLAHLKGTGSSLLELDVTSSEDIIDSKILEAWNIYPGGIDFVINNAGYILSAAFEELRQKDLEAVFRTNFHGPLNITRALLPKMRANGHGTLVFMSSQAGWHGDPSATGYCSSKFALEGAVECLSKELAIFAPSLKVLLFEPGYFNTRAFSNISHVGDRVNDYAEFNASVRAYEQSIIGNEPGDCVKGVQRMIEIIKGTGMAVGKEIPLRIPLGSDGWMRIKAKCEETLKICDDWKEVAKSTDLQAV